MEDNDLSQVRAVDWIFHALWTACGIEHFPRCKLSIPFTVLFSDGLPTKFLRSDNEGYLTRVSLNEINTLSRDSGEVGLMGRIYQSLRGLRKLMVQFLDSNNYQNTNSSNFYLCTVYYLDGEMETLSISTFDNLIRSDTWRAQVLMMQGFVPSVMEQVGYFSSEAVVKSKLVAHGTDITNQLTRAIAIYVERAYMAATGESPQLTIRELSAQFMVDQSSNVIFIRSTYLTVVIGKNRNTWEESEAKERSARELSAARAVANEVKQLMKLSLYRGLSFDQIFCHFDPENKGFIDASDLSGGLAKLGIGVTFIVAVSLLQIMGGIGSTFLHPRDLKRFVEEDIDILVSNKSEEEETEKMSEIPKRGKTRRHKTQSRKVVDVSKFQNQYSIAFQATELPLPVEAYKLPPSDLVKATDLPSWATVRQQRALQHLQKSKTLSQEKQENKLEPNSQLQTLSSSTMKQSSTRMQDVSDEFASLYNSPDELLHVDHGVIMSYRICRSSSVPPILKSNQNLLKRAVLEQRQNVLDGKKEINSSLSILESNSSTSFTIIVVPDLFMTLDTLNQNLAPLLDKYPTATIVLTGLPGLPNTHWPKSWVLSPDSQAKSILSLITHLKDSGKCSFESNDPILFLSFGTGTYTCSQFLTHLMPDWLSRQAKAFISCNGLFKLTKRFKRVCKELRESMLTAAVPEFNELLLSLHFSDSYVSRIGREQVLADFWKTRRSLVDKTKLNRNHSEGVAVLYTGILQQLQGFFMCPDDSLLQSALFSSAIPIIVIQSTEDVLIDPKYVASLLTKENLIPHGRKLAKHVSDSLLSNSIEVKWIQSGHEAIQERTSFIQAVLSELVQLLGISSQSFSRNMNSIADLSENAYGEDVIFAIDSNMSENHVAGAAEASLPRTLDSFSELAVDSLPDDISQVESKFIEEYKQQDLNLPAVKERNGRDKDVKKTSVMNRKGREQKEARIAEIERVKAKQREELERKQEKKEMMKMAKEDERSLYAEEYIHECEMAAKNAAIAKVKAEELFAQRKEEALRAVAEELAKKRFERLQERRRQSMMVVKQIESHEKVLGCNELGGYTPDISEGPLPLIAATHLLLRDMLSCKQKVVESMMRQRLVEQKTVMYREQKNKLEQEIRKLRQAIQLIKKDILLQGLGMSRKESDELEKNLSFKEDIFREFCLLGVAREEQLNAANRRVRSLKSSLKEKEAQANENIGQLRKFEKQLSSSLQQLKLDLEHLFISKDNLRSRRKIIEIRIKALENERTRIKAHTAEYIDSDVLNSGVLQRCVTKQLKKLLKAEYLKENDKLKIIDDENQSVLKGIELCTTKQETVLRQFDKVSIALRVFHKMIEKNQKSPLVDMLNDLDKKQREAVEHQQKREARASGVIVSDIGTSSLLVAVRSKDSDLRTKDERKFITIDMMIHPECYTHISTTEMEEMKFDPDYKCNLDLTDLNRIMKLPENVNLALPFLYTVEEVFCHHLINTYYRGKDELFYANCDRFDGSNKTADNNQIKDQDWRNADAVYDILLKESLRDRLRAIGPGDTLTEDERYWISIDKILAPEVYGLHENIALNAVQLEPSVKSKRHPNNRPRDGSDLLYMVIPSSSVEIVEGDKYSSLREKYSSSSFETEENTCQLSRGQLLQLHDMKVDDINEPVERKCKRLLDKYYVSHDESVFGHMRLKALSEAMNALYKSFQPSEETTSVDDSASLDQDSVESSSNQIKRVWGGSYEIIHPASTGSNSQASYFQAGIYNPSRDHPASFAISEQEENFDGLFSFHDDSDSDYHESPKRTVEQGLEVLQALPGNVKYRKHKDIKSTWFIVDSIAELARQDPKDCGGKIVLITMKDPKVIYEISDMELSARQSRSHYFEVVEKNDMFILDIYVTIVFQGTFGTKGYRLGRLAGSLFKVAKTENGQASIPVPVGYSPYRMQNPNLPDSLGRIVIVHKPQARPIPSSTFQIVVGTASTTKYSIQVSCHYARLAFNVVDERFQEARIQQARLPVCLTELESIQEGLRLAERKLTVVEKMVKEAEAEIKRVQKSVNVVNDKLLRDDETMELSEDQRKELINEQSILEIEFAEWAMSYASRSKEIDDIKAGISLMHKFQEERQTEKTKLKECLKQARQDIPSSFALLRNFQEASNVAILLNTIVQGETAAAMAMSSNAKSNAILDRLQTPAEVVRSKYRREGWNSLSLEEQQWSLMDQALVPHKYEWLKEKEEEEDQLRREQGKKPKKKKKYNAAIEAFRLSKFDIERILAQPFSMLNRTEMNARKLLSKYHDDIDILKREKHQILYGFDPHLAERTRVKEEKVMTKQEKEWATLDRVLHPELWQFYHKDKSKLAFLDKLGKDSLVKSTEHVTTAPATVDHSTVQTSVTNESRESARSKPDSVDVLMKLLDTNDDTLRKEANARTKNATLSNLVSNQQKAMIRGDTNEHWKCPFSRDELILIWKSNNINALKSEDERYAYKLLHKYNGSYSAYAELAKAYEKRRENRVRLGSHVRWDAHGNIFETDVDLRARQILHELDRAIANKNFWMDSQVLFTNDQRFPTEVLRLQLEDALDALLREQVKEREKIDRINFRKSTDDDSDVDISDSDELDDDEIENLTSSKIQKRALRRAKRQHNLKVDDFKTEVLKTRRFLLARRNKIDVPLELLQDEIGYGGCIACRQKTCTWMPSVDVEACSARLTELNQEIDRVRADPDQQVLTSTVCLSAQLGGTTVYTREDLLVELTSEKAEIERRIHLNNIDKELHDSYMARAEYIEVKHLHGYSTVMWANNARKALSDRQQRLIAMNVASEVVDDILNHMLEGWYFGERESSFSVSGFVPSIKTDSFIRSGQEQVQAVAIALTKAKQRADARKAEKLPPVALQGNWESKLRPIEESSQAKLKSLKVAREGTNYYHVLNETESTIKFGLFMLTFMYFRAMMLLAREKRSWGGENDAVGLNKNDTNSSMMLTDERRRMLEEENKVKSRQKKVAAVLSRARVGEARRRAREEQERKEAIQRLQAAVRQQAKEKESINLIQRVYRGHLGRKAARRWAMKRAELTAINALLNAAAVCVQRLWRGHLAREKAKQTRAEMAYFIALMRVQEAEMDEEEYWQTHTFQRLKRNVRNVVNEQFRQDYAVKMLGAPDIGDEFDEDNA